jgi:Protein of unknown function (DUF998)
LAPLIAAMGASASLLIVALLHLLKPELDPSWRMISEYEIGRWGWLMRLAFVLTAASCMALAAALEPFVGITAALVLTLVAIGPLGAAIFATEPITNPREHRGVADRVHVACAMLFIFGLPLAVTLINWRLAGLEGYILHQWSPWMTLAVWAALALFVGSIVYYGGGQGEFGPEVRIGWPNRIMMLVNLGWLIVVALAVA